MFTTGETVSLAKWIIDVKRMFTELPVTFE